MPASPARQDAWHQEPHEERMLTRDSQSTRWRMARDEFGGAAAKVPPPLHREHTKLPWGAESDG